MAQRVWDQYLTERDRAHLAMRPPRRRGFGEKPALLLIDLYRWVFGDKPEPILEAMKKWPGSCGLEGWGAIPQIQKLLTKSREVGIPIVHTTGLDGAGVAPRSPQRESELQANRDPEARDRFTRRYEIIDEVKPLSGETVLRKAGPSAFWGTPLIGHLNALHVDTIIACSNFFFFLPRRQRHCSCRSSFVVLALREQGVAFTEANAAPVTSAGPGRFRPSAPRSPGSLRPPSRLAEAAAVLDDDSDLLLAAELAAISTPRKRPPRSWWRPACSRTRARCSFAHAIVRDAVAARLSAGVRSALHARAAELLSARGASPDAVAGHLLADPAARTTLGGRRLPRNSWAGLALARSAPDEAAVRLRSMPCAEPPSSDEQLTLVLELARAESLLGRPDAVALYERVHDEAADDELRARAP